MNENAKKWVEALRSGEYRQGKGLLCAHNRFCCLGVACDLYIKEGNEMQQKTTAAGTVKYGDYEFYVVLPSEVRDWLGLKRNSGDYFVSTHAEGNSRDEKSLTRDNDIGMSFEEIADVIESEPKGLFVNE